MPITFSDIWRKADEIAKKNGPIPLVLLGATDEYSLKAMTAATSKGWIKPVLVRLKKNVKAQEKDGTLKVDENAELIIADDDAELVHSGVKYALDHGGIMMRGRVTARDMLHTFAQESCNFRIPKKLITHIGFFESEKFPRLIMVTDGGVTIKPTLEQKTEIVKNVIEVARAIGFEQPKVAMLAAVEAVYLAMEASLDDAVLAKMADRGNFGNALVDGPLSFDVALIPRAAKEKKVIGPVAGNADILVVNRIEVGNGLYKTLFLFGDARSAGLVVGGKVPVVMTSRSQSLDSKINSIALALVLNAAK